MASRKRSPENLGGSSSSGEIGQPVVGDEPCTFIKVRDVLYHCASSGELWLKLLDVARSLKIPTDCIITLEMRLTTKMTTYPGALIEILEAWRGKFSAEATLRTLINILELNKLTGCADALMVHFNVYEDADVVSRRKSTPKSNTWEKLLNHVRHKINTKPLLMNAGATSTSNHDQSSLETGDRDHHVVGDKPSTFVEVRDVLTRCAAVNKLWPKLIEVARSLQIPSETLVSLELRISTNIGTNPDALVEILEAWRGKFSSEATLHMFINVLETNGLGDCADALRMHFKAFDDAYVDLKLKQLGARKNLPDHFKSWMNRKIVEFQGNKVKLEELTPQISTHVDRKIIDELAGGKTPCIVNDNVPEHLGYYIHRTVTSRTILKATMFEEECEDVFVIEGMEKHKLSLLVPDNESTDVSGTQIVRLTVRFILLQHQPDFYKICNIASKPVHWIKHRSGRLEFVKSSGSVKNLQKHVDDCQDSFWEDELACKPERVLLIADSPGIGKTCILANLAHQIMREQPTMVVRFLVVKEFVDMLGKKKINTESIVKAIAEQSSKFEFGRKLVENALKTQACVLLFDGLDEVLSDQVVTAMQILQAATSLPASKVFVSTRPHFRDEIENELHVLSYTLQPFEEQNQILFLIKFWKAKGAIINDSLTQFANNCAKQVTSNLTDSERNIAGVPLQCRLIGETYEEHAIRCSQMGYNAYDGSEIVVVVNSMFEIYEKHMDMRFEKIIKSKINSLLSRLIRRNPYEIIKQAHTYFALELLFPEHSEEFKHLNKQSIPLNELCGLGILEATNSNDIRFVHRTFAEFLVAMLAHEYIQTNYQHRDILLSSLLKLTLENLTINNPFDLFYLNIDLESFDFCFPVICYFLNGFRKNEIPNQLSIDYYEEAIPYYIAAAFHNYENIPYIVTRSITNINPIETDEVFKCNLFYVTAMHSGLELMKVFGSVIDVTKINFMSIEESDESDAFMITPLHLAVQRGHYGLVDYLLKKLEGKLAQFRYLMYFCVQQSEGQSNAIVEDRIQIIKLLVNKNKGWIDEQLNYPTTPLMQNSIHVKLLECLIVEGANLNIRDKRGDTVLHAITRRNEFTPESYHSVLNSLNQRGYQHFNKSNNKYSEHITPLHLAVKYIEPLSITLELFISKGVDFNAVDKYNNTALHEAVFSKRSTSFLNSLIKAGADEEARGNFNSTVLHSAAESVNLTALKYFILRGHDVNVTDDDRQTPLHIAVRLSKETTHEMVVLLVEYGADVNAIDKFGKTPLSIANDNELNVEARTKEYLQIAKMELLLIKWKSEILSHNMDNFSELTNFESRLLQKLTSSGILTERNLEELESIETTLSRANKFYTMLLTKKFDFKMLLSVFSDSNNGAVLSIFVKELINFLYNALMKLEVLVVHHVMHTKGYADVINQFVQTLEEVDRQTYANKLSIVQLLCSLNPETLPPKGTEMYTPLRLVFHSDHMKKWELIQKITTHTVNQSEIQDLVYLCLANTHWHSEVDQRKRIITNTLQNHPYLFKKQSKPYPLLAPKIHVDLIILVINLRVDIRDTNEHKENLLHLCAKYLTPEEYHRVVSTLVEKQQTELFPCRDKEGDIPLHVAVEHLELLDLTIQLFASAKIEFNAVNKYKNTALHRAVLFKRSERILESLIKAGADDQARGQYNRTVLHYAAESGNLTALKYFISRGHDVNVTDEDGYTPLDLALKFSKTNTHEMVLLLVEHGADVNAINALD
ncbi:unnamed protein product [Orchesella dallaii]|uniref:Uncharacterized protein n=1 Tax=Orchesella dallaii TaxID=48710 RepID=A0ABP1RF06_9HEXA